MENIQVFSDLNFQISPSKQRVCEVCEDEIDETNMAEHLKNCKFFFQFTEKIIAYKCTFCSSKAYLSDEMFFHVKKFHQDTLFEILLDMKINKNFDSDSLEKSTKNELINHKEMDADGIKVKVDEFTCYVKVSKL